ncbi:helix-turn-helix transcriptional regulator [Halorubrum cibi]|uniref:Transcriptional regulator PadR-like family protein n=1 Tax=Halorubrum cibi TaxID=413815 RepID=A0A521DGD5_9EURY|nr:helix-turn-helix transcriptional regulator [Halorubrum cibi]SMO69990.1 Transcriptional regulator PadR-like family protein [Halorubrum cibi]
MPTTHGATGIARDNRPMTADDTPMSDAHTQPTTETNRDETARDGTTRDGPTWYDLLGFQRDLLLVAAEVEGDELPKGLTLKRRLDDRYSGEINHGRLYTNLNDLEDEGLIESERFDGRTNAYRVTDRGRELLATARDALDTALETGGEDA